MNDVILVWGGVGGQGGGNIYLYKNADLKQKNNKKEKNKARYTIVSIFTYKLRLISPLQSITTLPV